jgi:hypothetical protein
LGYLQSDEQYLLPKPTSSIPIEESDKSITLPQIEYAQGLTQLTKVQPENLPVESGIPTVGNVVGFEDDLDTVLLEKINITRADEIKKVNDSKTYIQALNSVPERLKIRPFKPTPKHFDLVSFDHVMKEGVGLSDAEIAEKGKHLSICIWLLLLFLVSFGSMLFMAFLKMVITAFVMGGLQPSYLVAFCYMGAATGLSAVLYISHQHMYWQYSRNKFGSIYDFFKDVQRHPIRLLPILFDPEVEGEDYV